MKIKFDEAKILEVLNDFLIYKNKFQFLKNFIKIYLFHIP